MLKSHMAAVESALLATSRIPSNSGHPLHKGTPREAFVRQFLQDHLGDTLALGTGEIIASDSRSGEARNQFDIVVFKRQFPKLSFGGGINAFLVESVVATIEVKSTLGKEELRSAVRAAHRVKQLPRSSTTSIFMGHLTPAPLCLVVAYNGPMQLATVRGWIDEIHQEEGIPVPELPVGDARNSVAAPSVDGVFLLGKGFVQFDNLPLTFVSGELRSQNPALRYYIGTTEDGTLLAFFMFLTSASAGLLGESPNLNGYLASFAVTVAL